MVINVNANMYKVRDGTFTITEFADFLGIAEDFLRRELRQNGIPHIISENDEVRIPYDCVERILFSEDNGRTRVEGGTG